MRSVDLNIYLPTDGTGGKQYKPPYKTLYFLNGFSASATELMTYMRFRRHCELKGIAVVFPNGENSFYVDHPERLTNFSTFIGKEVVEMTRMLLPLSDRREDTFLGGISMGGYGTLRNGAVFADTFGKIVAMSPALNTYEIVRCNPEAGFNRKMLDNLFGSEEVFENSDLSPEYSFLREKRDPMTLPELFLCCGRQDPLVYSQVKRFAEKLADTQVRYVYREADGGHDIDFWENMLDPAFSFLAGIPEESENTVPVV